MPPPRREIRSPLAAAVGERLRALRDARGLSVSEVARRSGLGKGTLSELESGRRNPTIETLYAVTTVLEVPLSAALPPAEDSAASEPLVGSAIEAVLVARFDDLTATTEVYRAALGAGTYQRSAAHAAGVTEHWLVFAGALTLGPLGARVPVAAGESTSFAADVEHDYRAAPGGDVAATLVVRYPR